MQRSAWSALMPSLRDLSDKCRGQVRRVWGEVAFVRFCGMFGFRRQLGPFGRAHSETGGRSVPLLMSPAGTGFAKVQEVQGLLVLVFPGWKGACILRRSVWYPNHLTARA